MEGLDWVLVVGGLGAAIVTCAVALIDYWRTRSDRSVSLEAADIKETTRKNALFGSLRESEAQEVEALQNLVASLEKNEGEAVVDVGPFIFIKSKNEGGNYQIISKRLTLFERMQLNENPDLLRNASSLKKLLGDAGLSRDELLKEIQSVKAQLLPQTK
ncbi:hypothetical protein [Phaeobacter inhibens]|uniref:hypothetical protein n=1 Tax=Phaeobacter inhibens TaxID=221822 RepID=UPI0021A3037C|nr:hypothetical protein [Phaeobacter inhibens]UWR57174.1 hypothetical protein K4F89_01590 [Phaeobacter inhibens]